MEPTIIIVFVIIVFAAVLGIIITSRQKRMKEMWTGKVTDKKIVTETRKSRDFDSKVDVYYLHITLADGTIKSISVAKKLYDSFSIDEKIEKKSGQYDPIKADLTSIE